MAETVRRLDFVAEAVAGFVGGVVVAFFSLLFVSIFLPTLFSDGLVGSVLGVVSVLDPSATPVGKLLVVTGGVFGAYWRYVFATRDGAPAVGDSGGE